MLDSFVLAAALSGIFVHPNPTPPPDLPMAVYRERRERVLAALGGCTALLAIGAVFTVEPGIYLPKQGFGIRIEDEVLMTEHGYRLLTSAIPRKLGDVEAWIAREWRTGHAEPATR